MRLVKVQSPEGSADEVARIAFAAGISKVSVNHTRVLRTGEAAAVEEVIEVSTSTPTAKKFIDTLMAAPFFDRENYAISVRQPRSIFNQEKISAITRPVVEPSVDIFEELWQFSQITYGFVGRIFLGALLLAYGLIENKLLFMIAGLLFIPLLPLMLAAGFGLWTRQFRLAGQGLFAFALATILLMTGGVLVAFLTDPPLKYNESHSMLTGLLISLVVGVAAGLATADDVGRREMIGLAATAQVAIIPTWFGICFVFGFPLLGAVPPVQRLLSFVMNIAAIIIASFVTYAALGMKGESLRAFSTKS